jgi:hypothetical protein
MTDFLRPRKKPSVLAVLLAAGFLGSFFIRADGPGTLPTIAAADTRAIDQALEGKTPGPSTQNLYIATTATVTNLYANTFVRNSNLWVGPKVDLTAISAYSNNEGSYGTKFAITAISPIHCLGAQHVNLKPGTMLNFVGVDNRTATRTVMASMNAADDIDVYLLDSELPRTITPMKILPANWQQYIQLNDDSDTPPIPVIFANQENRLYCAEAARIIPGPTSMVAYHLPSTSQRLAFSKQVISGDSSFPEMLLINGEPVIFTLWHFGGWGAGPLEASQFDAINAAMHTLSQKADLPTDYQLRTPFLEGFAKVSTTGQPSSPSAAAPATTDIPAGAPPATTVP